MNYTALPKSAATILVLTLALTACGGVGNPQDGTAGRTSGDTTRAPRPSAAPPSTAPTESPQVHTSIGPLLAVTDGLITKDPSVSFQIEDSVDGDPILDAGGEIVLREPMSARVHIDDADGFRDLVVLDGKAYANEGEAGSPTWRATGFQEAEADVYELAVHLLIPALKAGVTTVTPNGTVEEAGTTLVRYTYTAGTKATLDAMDLEIVDGKPPKQITGELWVHADSGDLRRVHMVVGAIQHNVDLQFGIAADIVAPPL